MLINSKSLTVNTPSNEGVPLPELVNEEASKKKRKRIPMFDALARVCNMEPKLVGSRIAKASHAVVKAGYTPEQVLAFTSYWQKTIDIRKRSVPQPLRRFTPIFLIRIC